jgi:hypothetical protein
MFIFEANAVSAGKTLLAESCVLITSGDDVETTPWPKHEAEMDKTIVTLLTDPNRQAVFFDNIRKKIESESLEALLTKHKYTARKLGSNKMLSVVNNVTWVVTVNNAKVTDDIARRSVTVRLDSPFEGSRAHRTYKVKGNLKDYVIEHDKDFQAALIALIQKWLDCGQPREERLSVGSFEAWAATVGGILKTAGFEGLIRCIEVSHERNEDQVDLKSLVGDSLEAFGGDWVTGLEIGQYCAKKGLFADHLTGCFTGDWEVKDNLVVGKAISAILKPVVGQTLLDCKILYKRSNTGAKYKFHPYDSTESIH